VKGRRWIQAESISVEDYMVDQQLLDILCCPETKQSVAVIEQSVVDKINTHIGAGGLKNRAGEEVKEMIDSGLVREDKRYVYPIRQDIPIMLIDEAIPFEQFV
jgi:uncharacterized protein YbaR (Trm112 family)